MRVRPGVLLSIALLAVVALVAAGIAAALLRSRPSEAATDLGGAPTSAATSATTTTAPAADSSPTSDRAQVAPPRATPVTPSPSSVARSTSPGRVVAFSTERPGGADVIPHQIVRTADDRLYVFTVSASGPNQQTLHVYWTLAPGLPTAAAAFAGSTTAFQAGSIISTDAAYNGASAIYVVMNLANGQTVVQPFDLASNTFGVVTVIATGTPTTPDPGTSGVSAMVDRSGTLRVAYWSEDNHISYQAFAYDERSGRVTARARATRLDAAGSANHPALAISPADGSLTVAWVSEANTPARILARTLHAGSWGPIEEVSTAPVWTSTNFGINIDQGPSLVIDAAGTRYLTYIENWDRTNQYGKIHEVSNDGSGWRDTDLGVYSHDPLVALNATRDLYIIGHGHQNDPTCPDHDSLCAMKRNADGSWGAFRLIVAPPAGYSFDASASSKWSVVGWYRPETIEFVFFAVPLRAGGGDYGAPTLWYGAIE